MIVYSVSFLKKIDSLFNNGFSRQFLAQTEGTDYGDGVYCNINIEDSRVRWSNFKRNGFDAVIVKIKVEGGLERYLIFNESLANKIYGECSIKNQVYSLFGEDADKVWRDFSNIMKSNYSARQHFNGRTAELLQILLMPKRKHELMSILPPEDRHRNIRSEYEMLFKKHNIRGAIYRGMKDGLCLVAYDFSDCKPFEYSEDGGRTWKKKEYKGYTVDVHKKYNLKYKSIDYPVRLNFDGDTYEFARVQKKNNLYNYIETSDGEEISPVDFQSVTLIDPDTGMFEIEYNNEFFPACVDGFFFDEDEVNMGENPHPFEELSNINNDNMFENQEQNFDTLLETIINETFDLFSDIKYPLYESASLEEAKYLDYEIPSLDELDSENYISIYHVTKSSSVNEIFKYGMDREYAKVMVYGDGVYTTPTIQMSRQLLGSYGDAMLQLKLIGGFDRFLMFEEGYAKKYYGKNIDILSQLKTMVPADVAEQLYRQYGNNIYSYSTIASKYNIRGAIYNWNRVIAVLPYDFSSPIPYAVSYDGGKTFKKKATQDTIDRFKSSVDVNYRFGNDYKNVEKAIAGNNENNELTGYSMITKKNGLQNYIDIQTGKPISPVDFQSITLMYADTGIFEIEYNNEFFPACVDGFFFDEDEMNMGEDPHPFEELLTLGDLSDELMDTF